MKTLLKLLMKLKFYHIYYSCLGQVSEHRLNYFFYYILQYVHRLPSVSSHAELDAGYLRNTILYCIQNLH